MSYEQGIEKAAQALNEDGEWLRKPEMIEVDVGRMLRLVVEAFLSAQPTEWMCEYPEFNDPACRVGHPNPEPRLARQPRKHSACRWVRIVERETP